MDLNVTPLGHESPSFHHKKNTLFDKGAIWNLISFLNFNNSFCKTQQFIFLMENFSKGEQSTFRNDAKYNGQIQKKTPKFWLNGRSLTQRLPKLQTVNTLLTSMNDWS